MHVADALGIAPFSHARAVAGLHGLRRQVDWVHIVDLPDPGPWVSKNQLLLSTGVSWPTDDKALRRLIAGLDARGVAGIALAVPRYLEHFPEAAMQEGNRLGLPLFEIPWEIPFSSITAALLGAIQAEHHRLAEQSELIHRELTRAAIEAESLDQIMAVFARLIGRGVVLEDPEGRVISHHGVDDLEDRVRRETLSRGATPADVIEHLREFGIWDRIGRATAAIRVPAFPELGFASRVVCPVRVKEEFLGSVWIIEGDHPLTDLDLRAAEHAATVVALQIVRDRAVASVETRLGYTLIDSLLEGRFREDDQLTLERAIRLGFDPGKSYRVSVFVLNEPVPLERSGFLKRERVIDRITRRLRLLGKPPLMTASMNEVILVSDDAVDIIQLFESMADPDVAVCVGRSHTGSAGVRRSHVEAKSIIPWCDFGTVTEYESVLVQRILSGDREAQRDFVEGIIHAIRRQLGSDAYLQTLVVLASKGFSHAQTAEELSLHPKTIQYRAARLQSTLAMDFADPETRFRLQLFARLHEFATRSRGSHQDQMFPFNWHEA